MVDPVFVEADPEPDIEEPAIRRRSSQPDLQHPFAPPSHTSQQQSPSATVPLQPPASTPVVTERDFHTPPKSVLTNSTGRTRAPSYPTRDAEDEKAFAVPGGGSSIRPIPTPESVLGLPVHGGHARKENTEGAEGEGLELNRAATNDTLPAHAGHTGDNEADHSDDEKVPEITWKASFKVGTLLRTCCRREAFADSCRTPSRKRHSYALCRSRSPLRGVYTFRVRAMLRSSSPA